jgi:hypothetical protein
LSTPNLGLPDPPTGDDDAGLGDDYLRALSDRLDLIVRPSLRGTFASRPAAGIAGRRYFATDMGVEFLDIGAAWLAIASSLPLVSTLPASPYDGQEVFFLADSNSATVWHLRYRAASPSATSKWEFLGGNDLYVDPDGEDSFTNTAYGTLAGGALTVPLRGDYQVEFGARLRTDAGATDAAAFAYFGPSAAAADDASVYVYNGSVSGMGVQSSGARIRRHLQVPAGASLGWQRRVTAGTGRISGRWASVRPIRLG